MVSKAANSLNIRQLGLQYFDGTATFSGVNGAVGTVAIGNGTSTIPTFSTKPTVSGVTISGTVTATNDAATKSYVDTAIAAVNPGTSVYAASVSNIPGTYTSVGSGIGDTFLTTATGTFTLDGTTPPLNSRILFKNQSVGPNTAAYNGVYVLTTNGTVSTGTLFTRAVDYDQPSNINSTGVIAVVNGTVNQLTAWLLTSMVTNVGTDAINYAAFGSFVTQPIQPGALDYFSTNGGDSAITAQGWLLCNSQILSQSTYPALYAAVGLLNNGGSEWTSSSIGLLRTMSTMSTMIYNGSTQFVAGVGSFIYTSTNGTTWTSQTSGTTSSITALTYGNSLYVFGTFGGGISTSTDAVTWTARTSNTSSSIYALTYGTVYVAGGQNGTLLSSTDGITWTVRNSTSTTTILSLTYNGSIYVASGPLGRILTSTDGTTWNTRTPDITQNSPGGPVLIYANSLYVGTNTSLGIINTSTDGLTWTGNNAGTASAINSITYGTVYLISGNGGFLATSTNGVTWTSITSGTASNLSAVAYGSVYVTGGAGGFIASSTDAITWTARTSNTTSWISAIAYGGSAYVAAGVGGAVVSSTDATTWTARTSNTSSTIICLTYGNGLFVYGGSGGTLGTSTDGTTWTARTSNTTNTIQCLAYGNSIYVYSSPGSIYTSTDAITWVQQLGSPVAVITGLAYNGSTFLIDSGSHIYTSTNGVVWTPNVDSSTTFTINSVIYDGLGNLVAASSNSILTSQNGTVWVTQTVPNLTATLSVIGCLTYTSGIYVGFTNNQIITSTNLTTWNIQQGNTTSSVVCCAASGTYFVAGATLGNFEYSPITYTYNTTISFQLPQDANIGIVTNVPSNFSRALYIFSGV